MKSNWFIFSAFLMLVITSCNLYAFAYALNKIPLYLFLFGQIMSFGVLFYITLTTGIAIGLSHSSHKKTENGKE